MKAENTEFQIAKLEQVVFSYILNDPKLYYLNSDLFSKDLFKNNSTVKEAFKAFKKIIDDGSTPDVISISNESKIDLMNIADLFSSIDYSFDFKASIQEIIKNSIRINLVTLANDILYSITRKDIFKIIEEVKASLNQIETTPLKRLTTISENIELLKEHIQRRNDKDIEALYTGLQKWDSFTGGLQPSDLIIIAGETSQGKTSLALTMCFNAATKFKGRFAIFSLEMSSLQLTARLTAMETNLSSKMLLYANLHTYNIQQVESMKDLPKADIYIDECSSSNIDYIVNGIKIAHMRHGIQVAIVDYLQLINSGNIKDNPETEIASNTRKLKNVAKELNITVIAISQLKRNPNDPTPSLSRLRGSGQIEEAADIVAFVYRPSVYNIDKYEDSNITTDGTAEIHIAKGRNVGIGKFILNYTPAITYFSNIEENGKASLPY